MTQPPARATPGGQAALTVALLGAALCTAFEAYGTVTAMPAAAEELGRLEWYAWAFTAFVIAQVLAIVLSGRLVDRIGPVWPLVGGMGVFTVGLFAAGLAPSMEVLLVSRFVQGLGAGASNLAFMVVVAQAYDARSRATMMSWLSFCWVLPSFLGPPVAAWLTESFSWHWVFLAVAPFLLGSLALGARPLARLQAARLPSRSITSPVPVWAAFAAAGGVAMLQLAGQWLNLPGLAVGAAGIVVLLLGLPRLMPAGFMRMGAGLASVMWSRGLASGAFFAAESFLPLLLISQYGFSLRDAGLFLAVGSSGWAIGSVIQARRELRIRRDQVVTLGMVAIAAGLGLTAATAWVHGHWVLMGIGFVFAGTGMGLAVASTSLANMQLSDGHLIGRNTSSLQVAEGMGNSLVTGLAGTIFAALHVGGDPPAAFAPIYLLSSLVAVLAIGASLRIGPVRNESSNVG